jgi:hypothetical protein
MVRNHKEEWWYNVECDGKPGWIFGAYLESTSVAAKTELNNTTPRNVSNPSSSKPVPSSNVDNKRTQADSLIKQGTESLNRKDYMSAYAFFARAYELDKSDSTKLKMDNARLNAEAQSAEGTQANARQKQIELDAKKRIEEQRAALKAQQKKDEQEKEEEAKKKEEEAKKKKKEDEQSMKLLIGIGSKIMKRAK